MNVVSRTSYVRALTPSLSVLAATLAIALAPVAHSSVFYVDNAADGACNRIADDPAAPGRYGSGSFANCGIASVAELLEETTGGNAGGSMVLNANGLFLNNRMELNGTLGLNGNKLLGLAAGAVAPGSTEGINGDQLASTNATVDALSAQLIGISDAAVEDTYIKVDGTVASARGGANAMAIGNNATTTAEGAIALGNNASATATGAIAIGNGASNTVNTSTNSIAIGRATSAGIASLALGDEAKAPVQNAMAVGRNAVVNGNRGAALGTDTVAAGDATAVGFAAKAEEAGAIAVGSRSGVGVGVTNGVAIGQSAVASANSSVALGSGATATAELTVSVGSATVKRKVVNVQAGDLGSGSFEAVNGAQLFATNERVNAAEGNITSIDGRVTSNTTNIGNLDTRVGTAETNITNNTTNIGGLTTRVGTAETNITTNATDISNLTTVVGGLSNGTAGLVTFDDPSATVKVAAAKGGTAVDFAGDDGAGNPQARRLTSVATGSETETSTDAINGSQLYATNQRVSAAEGTLISIDGRVTSNTTNIGNLTTRVGTAETNIANNSTDITNLTNVVGGLADGTAGLVTFDAPSSTVKVAATKGGTAVDFAGDDGAGNPQARRLTSVAAGSETATSTEAVNGAQLFATNERVTAAESNITSIDGRVTSNTTNIGNLTTLVDGLSGGTAGLVTYDDPSGTVKVAAAKGGSVVDYAGVDAGGNAITRRLVNVSNGLAAADSVNVSQLSPLVAALGGSASLDPVSGVVVGPTYAVQGGSFATVGDALAAIDSTVSGHDGRLIDLDTRLDDLAAGAAGLVTYDDASGRVIVGASKGGDAVDFSGTEGARRLSGVANGIDDGDAVSMGQLRAAGALDPVRGNLLTVLTYDDDSLARASLGGTDGTVIDNLGDGRVALGSREAINGGQLQSVQDTLQAQLDGLDARVGVVEQALEDGAGNGGPLPPGSGAGSVVIGDGADSSGDRSVAIGEGAQSSGDGALAIGAGASASGRDSVAIGNGSVADRDREYSVGAPGQERVVSNVAPGVRPTDAVNLQQLERGLQDGRDYTDARVHELDRRLDRMGAITAAYAGMATNTAGLAGDNRVGAGVGAQNGRTALAVGYQRILGTRKNVSVSLGGAFSGSDQSVSAGAGFSW